MTEQTKTAAPTAADIEHALAEGRDLKAWWAGVESGATEVNRFELVPAFPGGKAVWGFFGDAKAGGKTVPVMGAVGDYFFDLPSAPSADRSRCADWITAQVEEF